MMFRNVPHVVHAGNTGIDDDEDDGKKRAKKMRSVDQVLHVARRLVRRCGQ